MCDVKSAGVRFGALTRRVSEGERSTEFGIHHCSERSSSLTRRVSVRSWRSLLSYGALAWLTAFGTACGREPTPVASSAAKPVVATTDINPNNKPAAVETSWPLFRRTADLAGIASSSLPSKLKPKWQITSKDGFSSTAAIVGDHVYVGTLSGEMLCLKRASGETVWSYRTVEDPKPNSFLPGFQASPAVIGDSVFAGDEDGVFHAIDRATGKKKWTFTSNGQIIASANVVGERVIFGSYDSSLYCLKTTDGTKLWQYQTQDRVNGSPAVSDKHTFVTGCDQHMRVIDIETGEQAAEMQLERYLIASPAVSGEMLYVGTHESEVIALNWRKKEVVWRYNDPSRDQPFHSSAALTDKLVIVGGQDKILHAIDRATGQGVWTLPTRGQVNSSPVVVGDRVFVGSKDGFLYEAKLADGMLIEKYQVAGRGLSASPAVGEGCLVIGAEGNNGALVCFGE